jgi:ABC-type polysaccharide/polyol phosphate transport system ATPase subunit/SAM-dependent methyltransferase
MSLLIESEIRAAGSAREGKTRPDAEVVVRLENVSVEYRAPREQIRSFKEYAIRLLQGRVQHDEFKALRDVNLDVRQGEVMGVIGHNGAGKSTLLKLVSRVMKPTKGRVWVKGRIAPLLELGAGFHVELSGRENVFLNGTLIGYTQAEIEALFDEITDFAELGDFIDAPLRTYSTGMAVRLGFAVATARRPDILIVDEVLSVGDERFRQKCAARMDGFRKSGTTVLLVTHDSKQIISSCDRAAWLDHGCLRAIGDAQTVVDQYHDAYSPTIPSRGQARKGTTTDPAHDRPNFDEKVREIDWRYRFELPGGGTAPCSQPGETVQLHNDRLTMVHSVLKTLRDQDFSKLSCLDMGCHQGFFSVKMAEQGFRKVLGVDINEDRIEDAHLIRRLYNYPKLSFSHADARRLTPDDSGHYDVVLMLDLLASFENPINMFRVARLITKKLLIVETPVAPEAGGEVELGARGARKPVRGAFALVEQGENSSATEVGSTNLALYPGREALLFLLKRVGFSRVEIVPAPLGAAAPLASGARIMVAAYV